MALHGGLAVLLVFLLANIIPGSCLLPGQLEFLKFQRSHNDTVSDLIFLVDTSGSLWYWDYSSGSRKNGFTDEKVFVNSLLNQIRVSLPSTRVSVIMFGTQSTIEINYISNISPNNHKCNFKKDFKKLQFRWGMTNMHDAFQQAYDILFGKLSANKRPTKQVKTSVFLLTDGMWNDGGDPAPIAKTLKDNDIEIFSIGVSNGVSMNVLRQLATDSNHAFQYKDFKQFRELATYLRGDPYELDWQTGMDPSLCGSCDYRAVCACGLLSGEYRCACKAGYYGSGFISDCKACPVSTYKDFQGYAERCTSCTANSGHSKLNSATKSDCKCFVGYEGNPARDVACTIKKCDVFPVPPNSYIKGGKCNREYQSECELLCNEGYEISGGSGHRTCVLDDLAFARWSGNDPQCQQIICAPLQIPNADPSIGDCVPNSLAYKTTCTFKCKDGYILTGSKVRQCESDRTWSGSGTTCEAVKCPKLNSISLSQVNPPECIQQDMRFHSRCNFECPRGYNFNGTNSRAMLRFCETSGVWTNEYRACIDVEPPKITCPKDVQRDTDLRQDHAEITWTEPEYSDNSISEDPNAEVKVTSNFKSPQVFKIGITTVRYTVKDSAGFAVHCSFDVTIEDKEPPYYTSCPGDIFKETTSNGERVNWIVPEFVDNSNVPPVIYTDHNPGVFFSLGERFVHYTATDGSGNVNASCTFKVHVKAKGCPKYPPPVNGALACNAYGVANTVCQTSCNEKYDFAFRPAAAYVCANGAWATFGGPPPPFPDCSVRYTPGTARMAFLPQFFYYSGDCRDESAQEQIKRNFISLMSKNLPPQFCAADANCNVEHVNVFCGNTTASKRRRRSSVREVYVRVDIVAREKSGSQQSLSQLEDALDNQARPVLDASAKAADWSPLRQSTDLEYRTYSLTDAEAYCSDSGAVVGKCDSLQTKCDGLLVPHSQCQCNQQSGKIEKCIRCPTGTHYNLLEEKCNICKPGTYQNKEGRFECNKCPEGTSTLGNDKKNFTSCLAKCGPGYHSPSGLARCFACPSGKYSSGDMNTECTVCPAGTTTILPAAKGREECGMKCAPGTFSVNGVEPCKPCIAGFYQPGIGSMSCKECDGTKSTYGTGADAANMCVEIDNCASNPCNNGGLCVDEKHGYRCECAEGYTGKDCDTEKDECISNPCYQGATCVDKINGYGCVCAPGFTGKDCDVSTFNCNPNPCQNNGKCKVQPPSFSCECAAGFGGTFCEMKIDYCGGNPCQNGGTCKSLSEGFKCFCNPGYNGDRCQNNLDECAGEPCKNGATCEDRANGYVCKCKAGFEGPTCAFDVNECWSNPCQNGGRCVDKVNAYECLCSPTYAGVTCQRQLSSDYDLTFPRRAATSFATVRNIPDLSAFTIAFWMRTSDTDNPGTPLSYANTDQGKIQDNALVLTDVGAFVLYINNEKLFIGTSADDGKWHHIAVTWDNNGGKWYFYKDGQQVVKYSVAFQSDAIIRGGGFMVLGQEQDSLGDSFSPEEAFTGDLSQMQVWDRALTADKVYNLVHTCNSNQGNVKAWADFKESLQGVFVVTDRSYVCDYNSALRGFFSVRGNRLPNNDNKQLDNLSEEQCAQKCVTETSFPCRSFDYKMAEKKCYLSRALSRNVATVPAQGYDYYEMSCLDAVGVESKAISDSDLTASSSLDSTSQPKDGRLHSPKISNVQGFSDSSGGWMPSSSNTQQYLQVKLSSLQKITGVATQGADGSSNWVTSYKLQYSTDGNTWQYYPQTLSGNSDASSVVRHELNVITAQYVRFRPQAWNGRISLRVEVYGCVKDPIPPPPASGRRRRAAELIRSRRASPVENECTKKPCKNGATCLDLYFGYRCLCLPGYEGQDCDTSSPCGDPGTPMHGKKSSTNYNHGSVITFSCNAGFTLQGSSSRTCNKGAWSGAATRCIDVNECTSSRPCSHRCCNNVGSFTCSCRPGYKLNNNGRTCDDVNECALGVCSHTCYNTPGSFRCACPSGMELLPSGRTCKDKDECMTNNGGCGQSCENKYLSRKCHCHGGYNMVADKCTEISCPGLGVPSQGTKNSNGQPIFGNLVNFKCNQGYKSLGSAKRVCAADGQWTGKQPQCQAVVCVEVGVPKNGQRHLSNGLKYGSVASFSCTNGYALVGSQKRTCEGRGSWSGSQPRCVRSDCPKLSAPAHGKIEGFRTEIGSTVRVSCDTGYVVSPDSASFRQCGSNKQWTGQEGICKLVDCGDPGTPWHGYLSGSVFTYNSKVSYSCRAKHHLDGDTERVCQANGQWSGQQPKCLERSCGNPGRPSNGFTVGSNHTYGSTIQFACNQGYNLVGSASRTCQNTGQWSGTQPTCQIKSCGDPGTPSNAFRIGDKFTFGERIIFDCDPGYKLQGSISRTCQADGTWSGSQPTCAQSNCGQILRGPSGVFQSTNFPNNYPNNEYCTWKIQVPVGKKVRLDFTEFRTEENKDFVLIYDTDKTDPIVVFSGVKDKPRPITSSGNSVRVRFISNGENAKNGFKVSYKQTDCGGIYTSETGEIRSPGFPNSYPPNLSCTWLIFMSNKEIGLRLPEFNTENAYDRLEVAHGPWVTSALEIAWSGPSPLFGDVVTKQYMWIHFITSAQNDRVYKGFRATYKPYDPYAKK